MPRSYAQQNITETLKIAGLFKDTTKSIWDIINWLYLQMIYIGNYISKFFFVISWIIQRYIKWRIKWYFNIMTLN